MQEFILFVMYGGRLKPYEALASYLFGEDEVYDDLPHVIFKIGFDLHDLNLFKLCKVLES